MATMTLTEFNHNPAKATRLAESGEVVVLRRGTPAFRLVKVEQNLDQIQALVQAEVLIPPRAIRRRPSYPVSILDIGIDSTTLLESERNLFG